MEEAVSVLTNGNMAHLILTSFLNVDDLRESVGLAWEINCGLLLYEAQLAVSP